MANIKNRINSILTEAYLDADAQFDIRAKLEAKVGLPVASKALVSLLVHQVNNFWVKSPERDAALQTMKQCVKLLRGIQRYKNRFNDIVSDLNYLAQQQDKTLNDGLRLIQAEVAQLEQDRADHPNSAGGYEPRLSFDNMTGAKDY